MAADEDKIKLLLELLGFEKVDDAVASLLHMRDAATGAQDAVEDTGKAAAKAAAAQAPLIESSEKAAGAATHAAAEYGHLVSELIASANTYEVVDDTLDRHTRELIESIDATTRLNAESAKVVQSQAAVSRATNTTKITLGDFRQNLTGLGYVVNDFASVSGDMSQRLNAIANNLPMLLAGFGGLGLALSGIVPVLGILIKNWDHIVAAFTGETGIIKTTGSLDEMKDTLKEVNKELDDLGKARFDSLANAERYNKLVADQLALERNITAEKESQARAVKLAALRPKDEAEEAKAKAKVLQDRLGGQQEGLVSVVQQGLGDAEIRAREAERNRLVEDFNRLNQLSRQGEVFDEFGREIGETLDKLDSAIKKAEAEADKAIADRRQKAVDIVGKSLLEGDAGAFGQMQQAVDQAAGRAPQDPQLQKFRKEIKRATPEGRREMAEVAEEVDKELDDQFKAAIKEQNDLIDTLNVVGENNQKRFERTEKEQAEVEKNLAESRAEMERQREKFKADLARQNEQADKAIDKFQRDRANPEKAIQQQFAQQFQQATGADEATANEVAKRSLDLQQRGVDAMNATQQAVAEIQAAQGGLIQQYQMLQQRAAMLIGQAKQQAGRNGQADAMMPPTFFGWPN